jgi:hypothetical protein
MLRCLKDRESDCGAYYMPSLPVSHTVVSQYLVPNKICQRTKSMRTIVGFKIIAGSFVSIRGLLRLYTGCVCVLYYAMMVGCAWALERQRE